MKVPRIKTLKLTEITKPLDRELRERLLLSAVKRILCSDKMKIGTLQQKVIVTFAATFNENVRSAILAFLVADIKTYIDTALAWLFEEYSIIQVNNTKQQKHIFL